MRFGAMIAVLLLTCVGSAEQRYSVTGLVLKVDPAHRTMVVSCQTIPGYMDAMVMPFSVRQAKTLDGVAAGTMIDFTLVVGKRESHAESIHARGFESLSQEPLQARRLKLMQDLMGPASNGATPLGVGQHVPDFKLIDQKGRPVTLSQFYGKVVAMNFIYTRCALPEYCYRLSNNFGRLQKRFAQAMGRDLVLLTVTFDPVHDRPEVLNTYAQTWKADAEAWRFLTGPVPEVQQVCGMFGVDFWQDEALLTHTLHTVIIDRKGKMMANLEGNEFSAEQLGDLVENVLDKRSQ